MARRAARGRGAVLLAVTMLAAACASEPKVTLDDAVRAFDAGRYADSLRAATAVQRDADDLRTRQQAAYLVGCSAMELGRAGEARDAFAVAVRSADPVVSGRALAQQGALAVEAERWSDAASAYSAAAAKLTGADAQRARERADQCAERAAGRSARTAGASRVPAPGPALDQRPSALPAPVVPAPVTVTPAAPEAPWAVQAGAFGTEVAARQRAATLSKSLKAAKLPGPRVLSVKGTERTVWVVEIGPFEAREAADAAKAKILTGDATVVRSRVTTRR
jgi:hypothetical protein